MNINTGDLLALQDLYSREIAEQEGFVPVPKELEADALELLGGKNSALVDLKGASPLATFAAKERAKKKKARKQAKRSRQINRRHHV